MEAVTAPVEQSERKVVKAIGDIIKYRIAKNVGSLRDGPAPRSRSFAAILSPLSDDESLLKALEDDAGALYNAIDDEERQTVAKALRDSQLKEIPKVQKRLGVEPPEVEVTIYMVSNRPEYSRSNPTRNGVREVKVNTTNRHIQIGQTEINEVPRVEGENLLLFVHGFNNSATDAALAAFSLGYDLTGIDKIVFFSWPSKASVTSYYADYAIATNSVPFLEQCIEELASSRPGNVHIVAHSMGCRLLTTALLSRKDAPMLGQVYFIAGDVDQDLFLTAMQRIGKNNIVANISNIASNFDFPLKLSQWVNWRHRCGLYTPIVFCSSNPPSFTSLLRRHEDNHDSHSYFHADNIRADISNQVILFHTNVVPKPVGIRSTYRSPRQIQNTFVLSD